MNRPETHEFNPYHNTYISLIEGNDVLNVLDAQSAELRAAVGDLEEERGSYTYEAGKWSIKELLSHIIDGERIFAYRILRISRGDVTPIEGFEQDDYIETSNANNRSFVDMLDEFELTRRGNILMVKNIDDEGAKRIGTASGNPISVRAMTYIMAGHVTHHLRVLNERYLAT